MSTCLPINVRDLLYGRRVETPRVEFKGSWNEGPTGHQVVRTICAFANDFYNLNGGYVILGVEERGGVAVLPPKGLEPDRLEAIQRWIRGQCRRLDPEYQPILSPEVTDGRHLLVIWAPASQLRPHSAPGRSPGERAWWVRLGAETVAARGALLSELMQLTARVPFDDRRAAGFTLDDLRATLVREFLREVASALLDETDDLEIYRRLQLTAPMNGHEVPRNVALLFFSDEPERLSPGARIDVVQFANGAGGNVLEERIFRGPLHRQVRDCLGYLSNNVTHHIRKHDDRPEHTRWASYPMAALEEAIVNAVHHRDYQSTPDATKVYIYPDAVEVTSFPGPVPGLQPEDFRPGHRVPRKTARNRRIGELLKELGLAETRGTGVEKIFAAMARNGSPLPRFEFDEARNHFTVVLPVRPEPAPDVGPGPTVASGEPRPTRVRRELNVELPKVDRPRTRLDRKHHREVLTDAVRRLVASPQRRVTCVVAYGPPGNLVEDFVVQVVDALKDWADDPARIQRYDLSFPERRETLEGAHFGEHFRDLMQLQPGDEVGARFTARRGGPTAPLVFYLNWGCYGPGHLPALRSTHLETWLRFCCDHLAPACPEGSRILSYVALITPVERHQALQELIEALRLQPELRQPGFEILLLPALGEITVNDLVVFLEDEENTSCPCEYLHDVPDRIHEQTRGEFEATVKLLEEAERGMTWPELYRTLPKAPSPRPEGKDFEL